MDIKDTKCKKYNDTSQCKSLDCSLCNFRLPENLPPKDFSEMSDEELRDVYRDYYDSKTNECRCDSFVPNAIKLQNDIGGDFTLREAIEWTRMEFFEEVCDRFFLES